MGLLARSVPLPRWQGGVCAAVRERAGGGGCGEPQRPCWNEAGGSAPRYKFSTRTAPRLPLRMRLASGVWEGRGARVCARVGVLCARVGGGGAPRRRAGRLVALGACARRACGVLCASVYLSCERGGAGGACERYVLGRRGAGASTQWLGESGPRHLGHCGVYKEWSGSAGANGIWGAHLQLSCGVEKKLMALSFLGGGSIPTP